MATVSNELTRQLSIAKYNVKANLLFGHLLLGGLIVAIKSQPVLLLVLIICIGAFAVTRRYNDLIIVGIYSLCAISDVNYYCFSILSLAILPFLHHKIPASFSPIKRIFLFFLLFLIFLYLLQMFTNGSVLSLPLFVITFLSPFTIIFLIAKIPENKLSIPYILNHLLAIAISQAVIAFVFQALPLGISTILGRATYGDRLQGSTGSAPNLSVLLLVAVLPFFLNMFEVKLSKTKRLFTITTVIFFIGMIILNDAKTYLYAFVFSYVVLIFMKRYMLYQTLPKIVFTISFVLLLLILLSRSIFSFLGYTADKYAEYITGRYNSKALYYQYTFDPATRPLYQYLLGTGPGTNGSRASNALAYDVMYKKENSVKLPGFIPPASSPFTKRYLSKLYTVDYAESSGGRSALLGNPFNSICAIFIEFGVVGFLLYMFLIFKILQQLYLKKNALSLSAMLAICAILIVSFFDQTLEQPMPAHLMFTLAGLCLRTTTPNKLSVLGIKRHN
ncbi:hypothetical protein ACN9ML_00340 [Dyadobacter endophyticus]|uniref:hypothetical protein n=1 Tax=Dyadobacter TaxID=120831 RepID=UPI003CF11310